MSPATPIPGSGSGSGTGDHTFAWAGLRLELPAPLRPFHIEGRYQRGNIGLADEHGPRLQLAWALPKGRLDPAKALPRQLVQALPRRRRRAARNQVQRITCPGLDPAFMLEDDAPHRRRALGFAPDTGRAIEVIFHRREQAPGAAEDAAFRHVLEHLVDQPTDAPLRWAFFGHRVTTPPGYLYDAATLHIGDMQITCAHQQRRHASLSVRLIYPAQLALQRRPLDGWLVDLHEHDTRFGPIRYHQKQGKREPGFEQRQTPLGPARVAHSRLRWLMWLSPRRHPRRQRRWLVHDQAHDRLLAVRLADRPDQFEPVFEQILAGLYWSDDQVEHPPS